VLVRGHMGSGKSTIGRMLAAEFKDTHTFVYFDCTTKDLMDLGAPKVVRWEETGEDYLTMVPNEELGLHLQKPSSPSSLLTLQFRGQTQQSRNISRA